MADDLSYTSKAYEVEFTGPVSARLHYASESHMKKVQGTDLNKGIGSQSRITGQAESINSLNCSAIPAAIRWNSSSSQNLVVRDSFAGLVDNTEPTERIISIQARDPNRPPIQIRMSLGNEVTSREYYSPGDRGKCFVCAVDFTSKQHAVQHLSGSKHQKAMKRLKTGSSTSKPVAVCEPIYRSHVTDDAVCGTACEGTTSCTSTKKAIAANEDHVQSDRLNCLVSSSQIQHEMAASSTGDRTQWFYCDICKKPINSMEQLELHNNSPRHIKKASQKCISSNSVALNSLILTKNSEEIGLNVKGIDANTGGEGGGTSYSVSTDSSGQTWFHCSVCDKKMNTVQQWTIHRESPAHKKQADKKEKLFIVDCTTMSTNLASAAQNLLLSIEKTDDKQTVGSHVKVTIGNNNTSEGRLCIECNKHLNSERQWNDHIQGAQHCKRVKQLAAESASANCNFQGAKNSDNSTSNIEKVISCSQSNSDDVTVALVVSAENRSLKSDPSGSSASFPSASLSSCQEQVSGESLQDLKPVEHVEVLSGGQQMEFCRTLLYRRPGFRSRHIRRNCKSGFSDEVTVTPSDCCQPQVKLLMNNLPDNTSQAARNTEVDRSRQFDGDNDDNFCITTGSCKYPCCLFHCELCNTHLNSEDVKNTHLEGKIHVNNIKKAQRLEQANTGGANPFGAQFPYFCSLCRVPFNTLYDQKKHEKGQQHTAMALRHVPPPLRQLPDLVKILNVKDLDARSLTVSEPRKYQVELYKKAMKSDSICFLPTGEC
jgi:Zinc-finger of C2H2 type